MYHPFDQQEPAWPHDAFAGTNNFPPMNSCEILENWLSQFPFLTQRDCALFEPFLRTKKLAEREVLLKAGNTCTEMGFVNQGCFRVYYALDGKEINTQFIFEQQFVVDYDSFLQVKPSRCFIQALEPTEIVQFSFAELQNAYRLSHNWERFGRIMAEYSYQLTTQRVESFLFRDGEQRYLDLMATQPAIFDRIPLYHIASYLGLERESLSRIRRKVAHQ